MNPTCINCVEYCRTSSSNLNLIEFAVEKKVTIGQEIERQNGSVLYFAPAGNYPKDPVVTICGLATSVTAKEYMEQHVFNDQSIANVEEACLNSVYMGHMAINLALLVKAINLTKLIDRNISVAINSMDISINDLENDAFSKRSGTFIDVPEEMHLTQSMCCWSENNKSSFRPKWWQYSKECRSRGYFKNLIIRFMHSKRSKVFLLLGSNGNDNANLIRETLLRSEMGRSIQLHDLDNWQELNGKHSDKLIIVVHHPANTGFLYNNSKDGKYESILFNYYKQMNWDFNQKAYGRVKEDTMKRIAEYYKHIAGLIGRISGS